MESLSRPGVGVHGTVYDHEVWYGVPSTQSYDSSDSYAATFLTLVRAYYDTTGDAAFLRGIEADLRLVAGAIYSTMDPRDGLTYAKADYRIKYLMDNAEVYRGLLDWAYLLREVYGDAGEAGGRQDAQAVRATCWPCGKGPPLHAKDDAGVCSVRIGRRYPTPRHSSFPSGPIFWRQTGADRMGSPSQRRGVIRRLSWAWPDTLRRLCKTGRGVRRGSRRYVRMGRPWPWYIVTGWYLRMLKGTRRGQPFFRSPLRPPIRPARPLPLTADSLRARAGSPATACSWKTACRPLCSRTAGRSSMRKVPGAYWPNRP